ncbi:CRISPR-associated RAMP protein, partial [Candidatus Poribacteria bacterium]|nr:CRISPR-associated RAMP protein [Candidatus Poribacteria bacterium]
MIGFADFENRVIITGKIKLLSAMHIGKGQSLEPVGTDQPVVKDVLGRPFIPGSSFKGVLRSNAERIASTLYQEVSKAIRPCFITEENKNKDRNLCISYEKNIVNKDSEEVWKKL